MVLPITGPHSSETGVSTRGYGSHRNRVTGYRQVKPFDRPLAYARIDEWISFCKLVGDQPPPPWTNVWEGGNLSYLRGLPLTEAAPIGAEAIAKARKSFFGKISDRANVALALIERQQTLDLLSGRLFQLAHWANAVRRGRLGDAWGILRHDKQGERLRGSKSAPKVLANAWLQYWFGLSPLIADMSNLMEVLNTPFGVRRIAASARVRDVTELSAYNGGTFGWYQNYAKYDMLARARILADVRIDNPNTFLASRLGFTNPAVLAYEAVPFSFIVNWFVNIEEYLGQYDELHGIILENPVVSFQGWNTAQASERTFVTGIPVWGVDVIGHSYYQTRSLTIPDVTLGIRPPWRLSTTRGLTAASLVVQLFGGKSRLFG